MCGVGGGVRFVRDMAQIGSIIGVLYFRSGTLFTGVFPCKKNQKFPVSIYSIHIWKLLESLEKVSLKFPMCS